MKIQFKKLHTYAVAPKRGSEEAAGYDFTAAAVTYQRMLGDRLVDIPFGSLRHNDLVKCDSGIAMAIPAGYVGLAFARSSVIKTPLTLANCVGVLDSDYRGPISFFFRVLDPTEAAKIYKVGERIGQIVVVKHEELEFEETEGELRPTNRGTAGYGSTGK